MSHTPGPWFASSQNKYVRYKTSKGWNICSIEDQPPFTEANAKLIAAAPDLLAALKHAVLSLELHTAPNSPELINARAAIKKATS